MPRSRAWYTMRQDSPEDIARMADVIALVDDVFFAAKINETARQTGVSLETATSGAQLVAAAANSPGALVIVDLNARQGALEALEQLANSAPAGNPRRVVAFLSHVQAELAEKARAAGCAEVMPRSLFTKNLAAILQGSKS